MKETAELKKEKFDAIIVAQDLLYPKDVIEAIKNASSSMEIGRVLHTARHSCTSPFYR